MLNRLSRLLSLLSDQGATRYLLRTKAPSISSYRICKAVRSLGANPAVILDVGANQGQFANAAAWWFPQARIISFEPSPTTYPILRRNTRGLRSIQLVNSALGATSGELEFFENAYSHASSALEVTDAHRKMLPASGRTRRVVVPVTTLDQWVERESLAGSVLLKLDVQGFERKVLEGGSKFLSAVDYLLFECSLRPLYVGEPLFAEMYELSMDLGFDLIAPVGFLEDSNHVLVQLDLLWKRRG